MRGLAAWLAEERWLVGASLSRLSFGIWAVYFYLVHYAVREDLWGTRSPWTWTDFMRARQLLNVYQISPDPRVFQLVYHLGILIALAYTLGWHTRLMGVLHWFWVFSLQDRNAFVSDGGDNFMRLALFFLMFANTGAYFSIDSLRRAPRTGLLRDCLGVVHNTAVPLVLVQYGMLYMSTGIYKVMGEMWQNGTALYYILQVQTYGLPGHVEWLTHNPAGVVLATYGTVIWELAWFPLMIGNLWTRLFLIPTGIAFHSGIALYMGLLPFGWSLLSAYPLLIADPEYLRAASWVRRHFGITVLYDGWCPACRGSVTWLQAFDLFSLVQFRSFRDPLLLLRWNVPREDAERRIQSLGRHGRREGIDAIIGVVVRLPLLWWLVIILLPIRWVYGQRAYDALAARRVILVPGGCDAHCSVEASE